jgi:hypothetical protein
LAATLFFFLLLQYLSSFCSSGTNTYKIKYCPFLNIHLEISILKKTCATFPHWYL